MSTINNQNFAIAQNLLEANRLEHARIKREDPKALLATLSKSLEGILEQIEGDDSSNGGEVNSGTQLSSSSGSEGPTNAQMQQAIGALMGLLSSLEEQLALLGNEKAKMNQQISQALVTEMSAQVKQANTDLQKILDAGNQSDFWGDFLKGAEIAVGVVVAAIAVLCCQPAIAIIVLAMTVLAATGAMDKMTQELSKGLQEMGIPADVADVLASTLIILVTIAATAVTCGASAGAVAEEATDTAANAAEEGIEMTNVTAEDTANTAEETAENAANKAGNVGKNASKWAKAGKLGIFAGSQAVAGTNFSQYVATLSLSSMKDGETKDILTVVIELVIGLMAALAGGYAAAGVGAGSAANSTKVMGLLQNTKLATYAAQAAAQIAKGVTELQLAVATDELGKTQAFLTELKALIAMNTAQMDTDTKSLSGMLRTHAEQLVALTVDLNKAPAAEAQVLQA
jgi:spore maturation protein SpmB